MARVSCSISSKAMRMVNNNEAVISSGGVRLKDGTLYEMFKPARCSVLSKVVHGLGKGLTGTAKTVASLAMSLFGSGGINMVSSLAANAQCAFIQQGVNAANVKLDQAIERLGSIESAIQGLNMIPALSWATAAFSLANCGISVAGFHMTVKKLDQISGQIQALQNRYETDQNNAWNDLYSEYREHLLSDMEWLKDREDEPLHNRAASIEEHIDKTISILDGVMREFREKRIDGTLGCRIIFDLSSVFAQVLNEYCCQHYYARGSQHGRFETWRSVLDRIDSEAFREYLKRFLYFAPEYVSVPKAAKTAALNLAREAIWEQKNRLTVCAEMVRQLPEREFSGIDDLLNQRVMEGLFIQLPELKGKDPDQYLTMKIREAEFSEEDETVLIPLA